MSGRWRAWLGLLGSLLLVPVMVVGVASPAHACSCAMGDTKDYVKWADAVFTGTLVEVDAPGAGADSVVSSGDDVTMTIDADEVFKGDVAAQVGVVTARGGASCGISPPEGDGAWLWFVHFADDGSYAANLCGGSGPVKEETVAQVVDLLGPGAHPEAAPGSEGDDGSPGSPDGSAGDASEADAEDGQASSAVPWAVGGGVLLVGVVAAGVVAARRRAS